MFQVLMFYVIFMNRLSV